MKKENYSVLMALIVTIILLAIVIGIFFIVKKGSEEEDFLKIEEEKIEEVDYNITYIKPQEVFEAIRKEQFIIVDIRNNQEFSDHHIESSINIPLENLTPEHYSLKKDKTLLIIETEESNKGKEITDRLKKAGFKVNYLQGGLYAYLASGYDLVSYGDITSSEDRAKVNPIDLADLGGRLNQGERFIYLDVREKSAFEKNHFDNAINIPLENLEKNKRDIPIGKILIIDENPNRSFQASVRLNDMNILGTYYLINSYTEFKEAIKNETLL